MKTNPNDPLTPLNWTARPDGVPELTTLNNGLTKREYIATTVLQGIVAVFSGSKNAEEQAKKAGVTLSRTMALYAVDVADELIKALNEPQTTTP